MKNNIYQNILFFCIFMLFLLSMNIWLGWDERLRYCYYVISLIMVVTLMADKSRHLCYSWKTVVPLLSLIMAYSYIYEFHYPTIVSYFFPFSVIILLRKRDQVLCIDFITKWFAVLMVPCIITYALVQTNMLSPIGTVRLNHDSFYALSYVIRENYIFYVYSDFYGIRFNGPFIEPGHLGMMSAFLLFANGFDIKRKENVVIMLTLVLTWSLAGYVLALVGYIFTMYDQRKIQLKQVISFLVVVVIIFLYANFYNDGDNLLNELIFSRLESDEEKGISGNNRVDNEVMLYFYSLFLNEKLLLFGYGNDMYDWLASNRHGGTGIYMYAVRFGLVGSIAAMAFYLLYALFHKTKSIAFLFVIFVLSLFWQRSYPFWFSWIICFVYGITNHQYNLNYEDRNLNVSSES